MPRITFITPEGERQEIEAESGLSVMEIARMHDLGIEGACEGSIACATCHVIVDAAYADRLGEASAEEEDMLDLAARRAADFAPGLPDRADRGSGRSYRAPAASRLKAAHPAGSAGCSRRRSS